MYIYIHISTLRIPLEIGSNTSKFILCGGILDRGVDLFFYKFCNPTSFWKSEAVRNRLQSSSPSWLLLVFFDRSNLNLGDFTNLENSSKLIAPSPAKIGKKQKSVQNFPAAELDFLGPLTKWPEKKKKKTLSSYKLKMSQGVLKGIWTLRKPSVKRKVQKVCVKVEALLVAYLWLYIVPSQHLPFVDW